MADNRVSTAGLLRVVCAALLFVSASYMTAASAAEPQPPPRCSEPNRAVGEYFGLIEKTQTQNPEVVEALRAFPKGADLHNHLTGAIMPQDYLAMATADGNCYGTDPSDKSQFTIVSAEAFGKCKDGFHHLATAGADDGARIAQSLSMWRFPYPDIQSGHDQFFAAFGRFKPMSSVPWNIGPMLSKVLQQAHQDNVSHVETMLSFQSAAVSTLASHLRDDEKFPYSAYGDSGNYPAIYASLERGLKDAVAWAHNDITSYDNRTNAILKCGLPDRHPACAVSYAYVATVNRTLQVNKAPDLAAIFAQAAFSFLLASTDPRVVGVNLVSGEDSPISMASFKTQMDIFRFLHERFPSVNVALHAGEITPCFVTSNDSLKEHLSQSLTAGAKRIGHGVSFAYLNGDDQADIAKLFKKNDALVEIMFTSNAQILGVTGEKHPFPAYRALGVPTAFSTDDEGVSHADYTSEWIYGFEKYQLTAKDLVRLARESMQHSFLAGESLWADMETEKTVEQCGGVKAGAASPPAQCRSFLDRNPKAQAQWGLETKLAEYFHQGGERYQRLLNPAKAGGR